MLERKCPPPLFFPARRHLVTRCRYKARPDDRGHGKAVQPVGRKRNDYDIFAGIAREMGVEDVYTEYWLMNGLRRENRKRGDKGIDLPPLATLEEQGWYEIERRDDERVMRNVSCRP